jgi:WXG100 family type VII secretion target
MAEEFRADYEQLERIASLFESHADTVATVMREMQAQYDELIGQGNWIGRGSQAFAQEMTDLIFPAIVRLQDALREARSVTEQIAQITQDAEDEASARFDRR